MASLNSLIVRYRSVTLTAAASLLIITVAACSSITDSRRQADHARILVTGESATELTLITSIVFGVQFDENGQELIILGEADTAHVSLPVDQRVQFRGSDRVFVQLINPSMTEEAAVQLRVLIDGDEVYRQSATLVDASLRYMHFLF
jgi:hypothetical protein